MEIGAHALPPNAEEYKLVKGSIEECKGKCTEDAKCKGFKYTASKAECAFLSHEAPGPKEDASGPKEDVTTIANNSSMPQ